MRIRSGFTLLETLLYVATSSLLLFTITTFAITIIDARVKHSTIAEVEQQGVQVTDVLTYLIRNAAGITTPTPGNEGSTLTIDLVNNALDPTTIAVSSGVLQISQASPAVVTDLTSSTVVISDFTVINTGSSTQDVVQISFTLSRSNSSGRNPYSYTQTFSVTVPVNPNQQSPVI